MAKHIFLGSIGILFGIFFTGALGAWLDKEHKHSAPLWLLLMMLICLIFASGLILVGDSA